MGDRALATAHTGANCHDLEIVIPLADQVPPIKQPGRAPCKRPEKGVAGRGSDAEAKTRRPLRKRGIQPLIAQGRTDHGGGLGKLRYVVETSFNWLFGRRRLRPRYEKRPDTHETFLFPGCTMICWNRIMGVC